MANHNYYMEQLNTILSSAKKVFITSHLKPDTDAVSCLLAMHYYVSQVYPNVRADAYLSGEMTDSLNELYGFSQIKWVADISGYVNEYDTLIFVDASQLHRFTINPDKIDLTKFKSICFDHHNNEPSKFTYIVNEFNEPSCSQVLYKHLFKERSDLLNPAIGEVLLTGIMGDTGSLRYIGSKTSNTLLLVKELLDATGLQIKTIKEKYFGYSVSDWEIIAALITNTRLVSDYQHPFLYSYLPLEFLDKYSTNTIKQAKNKFLFLVSGTIKGYKWGFVATPDTLKNVNLSFRSGPDSVNVRLLAEQYFNGGGHDQTSGGEVVLSDNQTVEDLVYKMESQIKSLSDLPLIVKTP